MPRTALKDKLQQQKYKISKSLHLKNNILE